MSNGVVASVHLHPIISGDPFLPANELALVAEKGIKGNGEGRMYDNGSRRQVSLIGREQLSKHAKALACPIFSPGDARSNIETEGINLIEWIGCNARIGEAELYLYAPRTPCQKMDAIVNGLREQMADGNQGVMAEVTRSGTILVGDIITLGS